MVHLLLGPVAGGKTTALLEQLAAGNTPAGLLLPRSLLVEEMKRRLRPTPLAERIRPLDFDTLSDLILQKSGSSPAPVDIGTQYMLVRHLARHLADEGCLPHFAPIAHTGGFVRAAVIFLGECIGGLLAPDALKAVAEEANMPRLRDLATLYAAYLDFLRRHNLADRLFRQRLALDALLADGKTLSPWPLLGVDGFDQFSPLQLHLLATLARQGVNVLITLSHHPHRTAYARFRRTLEEAREVFRLRGLSVAEETVTAHRANRHPVLEHVTCHLFEPVAPSAPEEQKAPILLIEAASVEDEVRAVLRHVRWLIEEGTSPDEILIVAHQVDDLAPLLRRVAREYAVPLHLAHEEPLAATPFAAHLSVLLETASRGFRRDDLLDLWHSPYFGWEWPDAETAAQLEHLSAEEIVVRGRAQWLEALTPLAEEDLHREDDDRLRASLAPEELEEWRERLCAFFDAITPPNRATFADYAGWLRDLLAGARLPECLSASDDPYRQARDQAAWETFTRQLEALVRGAEIVGLGETDWPTFAASLRAMLRGVRLPPTSAEQPAVLVADPVAARGLQRPVLCLLRLNEGAWPAPTPPDPLLRHADRRQLAENHGLPLRPPDTTAPAATFYELVAHARRLVLSRTRFDEKGTPWPPSPFWVALVEQLHPTVRQACTLTVRRGVVPSPEEALTPAEAALAAVVYRQPPKAEDALFAHVQHALHVEKRRLKGEGGLYDGQVGSDPAIRELIRQQAANRPWSPTAFRDYTSSPARYFTLRVLGLRPPEPVREGVHRRHYGQVVHAILERLFANLTGPLTPETLPDALDMLEEAAQAVFNEAPHLFGFRPDALWTWEQRDIVRTLRRLLRWKATSGKFPRAAPWKQEVRVTFGFDAGEGLTVRVTGFIDRIDRDEEGRLHLYDYKTGNTPISAEDVRQGYHVQLPIYWWGAQDRFGAPVASARFVHVRACKTSAEFTADEFAQIEDQVRRTMQDVIRRVFEGEFPASPSNPERDGRCAGYCELSDFCRCPTRRL